MAEKWLPKQWMVFGFGFCWICWIRIRFREPNPNLRPNPNLWELVVLHALTLLFLGGGGSPCKKIHTFPPDFDLPARLRLVYPPPNLPLEMIRNADSDSEQRFGFAFGFGTKIRVRKNPFIDKKPKLLLFFSAFVIKSSTKISRFSGFCALS